MPAPRRSFKHVNWQSLRELIAHGATLEQLAKQFDIPYRTLASRSYRERWNVHALRANLPPQSKTRRKDHDPNQLKIVRNGVLLPLVKLASYYSALDVQSLRSEQAQFLQFANTALKVLQSNDPKHAGPNASINLALLSVRPSVPALGASEVQPLQVVQDEQSKPESTTKGNPVG